MYNEKCNTFVDEVSSDVFMMLQHESVFIVVKGLWSTDIWKEICYWTQTWQGNICDCKICHQFIMEGNYRMFVGTSY
jgi:hypothetical protein